MKVTVEFDLDERYRDVEKRSTSAQDLLEKIIYDYQCGMVCIKSILFDSPRLHARIVPNKDED